MAKALQGGLGIVPSWTARERCGYLADAQAVAVVVTGLVTGHGAMVIDVIGVGVVDMIFLLLRFLGWRTCFGYTGRRTRRYHDFVLTQISVTNMSAIFHLPITSWIDSVLINSSPDVIICARIKSRCAGNPYHGNKFLLFGWWPPWHIWSFGDLIITVTCKVIALNCRKATPPTWTSPTTSGDSPGARFGHSAVMDGTGKMWIFGGDRNGGRFSWMVSRSGLDAFWGRSIGLNVQ